MPISVNAVYSIDEFRKLTGMGPDAFAVACRSGLRTLKSGTRKYVRGADWESFLLSQNKVNSSRGEK